MNSVTCKTTNVPYWAKGEWEEANDETSVKYSISITELKIGFRISINAFDKCDNEKLQIYNVKYCDGAITFDSIVKSTNYWAGHEITMGESDTEIIHYIRLKERFKKCR